MGYQKYCREANRARTKERLLNEMNPTTTIVINNASRRLHTIPTPLASICTIFFVLERGGCMVEDNAPVHNAKICEDARKAYRLDRMKWPAASPALNPIEN